MGSQHIALAPPVGQPPMGKLVRARIPLSDGGRYPTTEEVLSALGVVVNKGNLGALQDITRRRTTRSLAGGQFAGLIPGSPNWPRRWTGRPTTSSRRPKG